MICGAADAFWNNSILFCNATYVRPKTFSDIGSQHGDALFCAKDTMDVRHEKVFAIYKGQRFYPKS
jgi:hypothetical protein